MEPIHLDKDDFDRANWQNVISECNEKDCLTYSIHFNRKAEEEASKNDLKNKAIFELLSIVTLPTLSESKEIPFASIDLFDRLDQNHLKLLKELVLCISDAEMRARVSDLLWIKEKDYKSAIIAVDSYIESSKILLHPENWPLSFIRIRRAVDIAASIGKNTEHFKKVINYVETILETYNGNDPKFLSTNLMELLQEFKKGDIEHYASLSEKIALKAEDDHDWWKAEHAWKIKAKWHKLAKEEEKEKDSQKKLAETYVKNAADDIKKNPPDYLNACGRIENAIQQYRKIGNKTERIAELHQLLLEYQSKSSSQMIPTTQYEFSIPDEKINEAKEFVRGKSLQEAIFALASISRSPEVSKLREEVETIKLEHPLTDLFANTVLVNENGKQIYKKRSTISGNADDKEKATKDEMFKHAKFYHLYSVFGAIEPARKQIMQEHNEVKIDDLLLLVSFNPFVPAGRELIYASGLHAGLRGDFLTSIHLLIPQLENSVRYVLNSNGIISSGLDQSGIQNESGLNITLDSPIIEKLNEIIPENIVFDLKGLLIERYGSNLRHKMAHGLIDYSEYESSVEVKYLWWLTLNLCYIWKFFSRQSDEDKFE